MNKMRIAYVGNFEPEYSTENDVRKAFETLGYEVIKLQEGDKYNSNKASIDAIYRAVDEADMLLWTGTWGDAYPLSDVLTLFHHCAVKNIPTATLHLDTFWSTGRNNREWWLEPMFFTSHLFTADGDWQRQWELLGKKHTWLPPAVRHNAVKKGTPRPEYSCDVAFVGSNGIGYHEDVWPYRRELVDALRAMCDKNGWKFKNPGGDEPKIERSDDMNDFYASAKITVGDSLCLNKEKAKYWSDRVSEATGRGGFLIMPEIDALNEMGWRIPTYEWGRYDDLENLIMTYLNNEVERKQVIDFNFDVTSKSHTYVNRVQTILKEVGL